MGHRHIGQSVIVVMVAFLARVAVAVDDDEALLPAAEELIASSFLCVVQRNGPQIKLARCWDYFFSEHPLPTTAATRT
jgi:hypothetical protein